MKWVNPPVAYMLHAGVPLLIDAGASLPGLHAGDPNRLALEGYPGLTARELIGRRSYKSDSKAMQTPEMQKRLELDAIESRLMSPEEFTRFIESEIARWAPLAKSLAATNPQ